MDPKLSPLVRIETLRPNGLVLETEDHAFATPTTIEAHCATIRLRVRNDRGWTPTFRILRVDRDVTPWSVTDVTGIHRVN